ncbi:MAG: ABC transporter ATP-binding protein [Ignavibacteriae bacterium]|nr:MAG: ABC transporter ATP-binding protein [Ignavibacteriota bacterium]
MIRENDLTTPALLQCRNLSKTFHLGLRKLEVLRHIDFQIYPGETVLLFGKCGHGKSVLLSLLCGLDQPTTGDINFDGTWFHSCTQNQLAYLRRTQIGIIFQNLNLLPKWTALENVAAGLEDVVSSTKTRYSLAQNLLEEMGMGSRLDHLPIELSMGEQQRVAIARTLIREPKLILADEPTGDLDAVTAGQILHIFHSYLKKTNSTLLVATHGIYPDTKCDRILNLNHGSLSQLVYQNTEPLWKVV